jgi:glycosyltransferase involved in cell wall biosynthesis
MWASWTRQTLRYEWRRLRAATLLKLFPPTLAIHNEFPYPGYWAHRILYQARRRMILVHSTRECIARFLRNRKVLTPALVAGELARMHGLVFVSPQLRDDWAEISDIGDIPQWVVPNTCREDDAKPVLAAGRDQLRSSLGLPREAFIAVCVGYVHDGKGQDTLIEALSEMVRATPDLLVAFVGNDRSEWAAALKNRIALAGLARHVLFAGLRPDPYSWIHAADLLIHPSRTEGQGIVLLEAMLLRTPVLATNVGGIPSAITHGETGWLMPPDDPGALAEGFRTLAGDGDLRRGLADRAEQVYWSRFNRAGHHAHFCTIVESMLAESRGSPVRERWNGKERRRHRDLSYAGPERRLATP